MSTRKKNACEMVNKRAWDDSAERTYCLSLLKTTINLYILFNVCNMLMKSDPNKL